jgi:uncharacterized membrane protein YcaP (DUF421 family)
MENIFFENWESILRITIITIMAYFFMIVFLRSSGKRTLSKMNAFDFIVTVALGSALANVALNKEIPLAEGALAFFLLIFLQYFITWLSVRVKAFRNLVTSRPTLLLFRGELYEDVLKKQRITQEEIHVAARQNGFSRLEDIGVIILETTGELTIMGEINDIDAQTISNVKK